MTSRASGEVRIRHAVATAKVVPPSVKGSAKNANKGGRADREARRLIDDLELWNNPRREAFATVLVNGHRENWPIHSERFKGFLRYNALQSGGPLLGKTEIEKICDTLAAHAIYGAACHEVWTRVGEKDGRLYVDLGGPDWQCVEIAPAALESDGPHWKILPEAPIKFVRRPAMLEMPEPKAGGGIDLLRTFLNVEAESDFQLAAGWMVACYRAKGPYPICVIKGTQGSGKSNMLRLLSRLIDPIQAPERNLPKEERELFVSAQGSHLLTFDNLSAVPAGMADALCRVATGGGFSTRSLHTNDDEHIMQARKPILLNGIPDLTRRADLADRSIVITARRLTSDRRRPEEEFWRDFADNEPLILGAMFDAIAYALRVYPDIPAPAVRMSDAARFMAAAGEAFGWDRGTFGKLLTANRLQAIDTVLESDPFAQVLLGLLEAESEWRGSSGELLSKLTERAPDKLRRAAFWPTTPSGTAAALDRIKDALEAKGFAYERGREGAKNERRFVQFRPVGDDPNR